MVWATEGVLAAVDLARLPREIEISLPETMIEFVKKLFVSEWDLGADDYPLLWGDREG